MDCRLEGMSWALGAAYGRDPALKEHLILQIIPIGRFELTRNGRSKIWDRHQLRICSLDILRQMFHRRFGASRASQVLGKESSGAVEPPLPNQQVCKQRSTEAIRQSAP